MTIPARVATKQKLLMLGVVALLISGGVLLLASRHSSVLPSEVAAQVSTPVLLPGTASSDEIRRTAKYDASGQILSFRSTDPNTGITITYAEQPTPDKFTDIPQYAARFFEQAGEYKSFETRIGTAHLIRSTRVKDAAAINAKGTLVFLNPDKPLTETEWRKLFSTIDVQ